MLEAIEVARLTGGKVRVVHALDVLTFPAGFETVAAYTAELMPRARRHGLGLLEHAHSMVTEAGLPCQTELLEGHAGRVGDQVIDEASRWGADLIVIGTHGRRGIERSLLGSDAQIHDDRRQVAPDQVPLYPNLRSFPQSPWRLKMRSATALAIVAAVSFSVTAQSTQDEAGSHSRDSSAPASEAGSGRRDAIAAQMDERMKAMREMHEKVMTARSPDERQALMADHMKAMQGGMSMMSRMRDSQREGMRVNAEAMSRRMDMMEMMMQMMMDREAVRMPAR